MKKFLLLFPLFLTSCASFHYRINAWYNEDPDNSEVILLDNGSRVNIVGNPRITCYTSEGVKIADGLFVTIKDDELIVDEFGKAFVSVASAEGNYCTLWEQK
jgi:hypothetical protein